MSGDVCLMIIYNHRYDANIDKLEKIYASRFKDIYHIMPFYDGVKENVIPVYECSFRFEGYVAQAINYVQMKCGHKKYEHFFFVADDIVLHPGISESTYKDWFGLNEKSGFITFTKPISKMGGWAINRRFMDPFPKFEWYNGTLWKNEIMSKEAAFAIAGEKGFQKEDFFVDLHMIWTARKWIKEYPRLFVWFFKVLLLGKQFCPYPIWGGYSDVFIVPGENIGEFAHMLGVFAAMGLFVEMAIPTAMQLLYVKVVEENDLPCKSKTMWGNEEREAFEGKYQQKYRKLIEDWDEDCLFVHPIKLSKWEL